MNITVRKQEFTVESNRDHTLLKATVDGQEVSASTLPLLVKAITNLLEVPKAAVPVMSMATPDSWINKTNKIVFRKGTLTGVHASNNNLLVRWDGAKSPVQISGYGEDVLGNLAPEQQAEFQQTFDAYKAATKAWSELKQKHSISGPEGRRLVKEYHKEREKGTKAKAT